MGFVYTVQQGDCLSSLAKAFGFALFHSIYDHPNNAAFRQLRPNPNVLLPGDQLYIPDKTPRTEAVSTDDTHRFQVKTTKTMIRIVAVDPSGQPLKKRAYTLTVGTKKTKGQTGSDGLIEAEVEADASEASLSVAGVGPQEPPFVRVLSLGSLDPATEVSGAQGRLRNLGFDCGEPDGVLDDDTAGAVAAFQRCYGQQIDGALEAAVQDKLKQAHGS